MRFSPNRFNRHLANLGQQYLWSQSFGCSCVNPNSGAPDPRCQVCLGKGVFWPSSVEVVAATASQKTQMNWQQGGMYEAGDIVVSIPGDSPLWDAGQFDRVVMLNASDRFSQPFVRGAVSERLLFRPQRFERVFWKHPQTQAIVEGGLPVAAANGTLSWPNGGEPPAGTSYSLTGWKHSEYFVYMDLPRNRNMHSGARLPKYVVLRRWDLMGR